MATEKRGLRSIKTVSNLMDRRRVRSVAGAHIELSSLATEKAILTAEMGRCRRRIAEKTARLVQFTERPELPPALPPAPGAPAPLVQPGDEGDQIVAREFDY